MFFGRLTVAMQKSFFTDTLKITLGKRLLVPEDTERLDFLFWHMEK
jgi:hypothetical protein